MGELQLFSGDELCWPRPSIVYVSRTASWAYSDFILCYWQCASITAPPCFDCFAFDLRLWDLTHSYFPFTFFSWLYFSFLSDVLPPIPICITELVSFVFVNVFVIRDSFIFFFYGQSLFSLFLHCCFSAFFSSIDIPFF